MKTAFFQRLAVLALLFAGVRAEAASTIRLIYGESWSRAGRELKATLSGSEFRTLAKGEYVLECVDESGGRASPENLGSLKLPAIFVISEGGNCFHVYENVPAGLTVKRLLARVRKVDAIRREGERTGFATAENCGEFLSKMERFVGGPRRVIAKGFYWDVFQKLKQLDPMDETGWIRHFSLGEEFDRNTKADGLELVIKANEFREKGDFSGGEAFVSRQMNNLPRKRLTKEQQQSLLMARFALYREDASKREEMLGLLRKVAAFDEDTFWGTAAVGWLNLLKEPPLSTYWGWRKGDFKGPQLKQTVKYGVDCRFKRAGTYTVSFVRGAGSPDAPRFESVKLLARDEVVATLDKPKVEGDATTFEFVLDREFRGKITAMTVNGTAAPGGDSFGEIRIERRVLRPRKEKAAASGAAATAGAGQATGKKTGSVADYIRQSVDKGTIADIQRREGGAAFLAKFFKDVAWMEQFAGSGLWDTNPWRDGRFKGDAEARLAHDVMLASKALEALDLLVWNDRDGFIDTKLGRNVATALALNHGADFAPEKLVQIMECYREWARNGTLHDAALKHDTARWREVLTFGQNAGLPVENLRWIHDFANLDAERYYGVCWQCAYRLFNCFGASVHGPMYYAPWHHRWNIQELRYRVGGVCGALSKFGSHAAASHGIRSYTAGQPGHCAYMLWDYNHDRWGIAYAVTGHTGPHFSLGGGMFAGAEEWNRYFGSKTRMEAERLRWKGEYAKAMRMAPGNWQAAEDWLLRLQAKNAPVAEWTEFVDALCETFRTAPAQGWTLYLHYLRKLDGRAAKIDAAKRGFAAFQEFPGETSEAPYFDEIALEPVAKLLDGDTKALWEILPAALDGQAKSKTFYRQLINWSAQKLMTDAETSKRFLTVVGKSALKTGASLDYRGMILKAAESGDIAMFRQVYQLMDKLAPDLKPKPGDRAWPLERDGGKLLSPDGLLKISKTCGYDNPINYRNALDAQDFKAGNAFHTDGETAPWGIVVLPGSSEITGVTVVNSGSAYNATRQVPIRVWLSDDGIDWQQVYASDKVESEWKCTLQTPVKARYIKVGRAPDAKKEVFHLHKILVYGKKLY